MHQRQYPDDIAGVFQDFFTVPSGRFVSFVAPRIGEIMSSAALMLATFLSTLAALACACTPSVKGSVSPDSRSWTGDVVTAAELRQTGLGKSLLVALQQTRPGFLRRRGTAPLVSIDGGPVTELGVLQLIPAGDVQEIRMARATAGDNRSALMPNGDVIVGDVLLVRTRKR